MRSMKISFLGGTDEIGASSLLLEVSGTRILVDCGIRLGSRDALPDLDLISEAGGVDAVVVTHGHLDHIGALPVLHRGFPDTPIYATPPTIGLAEIMLRDAAKLMSLEESREEEIPLYSARTAASLTRHIIPVQPGLPEKIGDEVTATFFLCGHILGASCVGIEGPEGRVLFSGDISWADQLSVSGMSLPPFKPDLLVLESTYGDRVHADRSRQEDQLARQVAEAVTAGGTVLIPAFAVGRAQEVLLILRRAMRLGRIPRFPVWVDGLVRPVCRLYTAFEAYLRPRLRQLVERIGDPFFGDLEEIKPVESPEDRDKILAGPPCAIVSSSGMLSGGASVYYARHLVGNERALITITGYQDEETPGRRLLEASEGRSTSLVLGGQEMPIACAIKKYHLSAHADASELVGLAARLKPADTILVHGEGQSREQLARQLGPEPVGRIHLPAGGTTLQLLGRKRVFRGPVKPIGKGRPLADGLPELAHHALTMRGERARWQVAQLMRLWGEETVSIEEAEALLLGSGFFARDPARPFSVKVAPPGGTTAEQTAADPVSRTLERLGPESGLYRHSVDRTARELTLRFYFPKRAEERWTEELDALLKPAEWSWRIHPSPHSGMLVARATELIEREGGQHVKTSVHLDRDEVVVRVKQALKKAAVEEAGRAFRDETGFDLKIETAPAYCLPKQRMRADGRMEINATFKTIDETFQDRPHQPYRKRLLGQKTIEILFISPQIGERYRDVLAELEEITGWPMAIGAQANQHRIKEIAVTLLAELRVTPQKNPRYFGGKQLLVLPVSALPPEATRTQLAERFAEATGFSIELEME